MGPFIRHEGYILLLSTHQDVKNKKHAIKTFKISTKTECFEKQKMIHTRQLDNPAPKRSSCYNALDLLHAEAFFTDL